MKKFALVLSIASALFLGLTLIHNGTVLADDPPIWDSCTGGLIPSACVKTP